MGLIPAFLKGRHQIAPALADQFVGEKIPIANDDPYGDGAARFYLHTRLTGYNEFDFVIVEYLLLIFFDAGIGNDVID